MLLYLNENCSLYWSMFLFVFFNVQYEMGLKSSRGATAYWKEEDDELVREGCRNLLDASRARPIVVTNFGGGLCPTVDVY